MADCPLVKSSNPAYPNYPKRRKPPNCRTTSAAVAVAVVGRTRRRRGLPVAVAGPAAAVAVFVQAKVSL